MFDTGSFDGVHRFTQPEGAIEEDESERFLPCGVLFAYFASMAEWF